LKAPLAYIIHHVCIISLKHIRAGGPEIVAAHDTEVVGNSKEKQGVLCGTCGTDAWVPTPSPGNEVIAMPAAPKLS
jgi:hypothetical protein